MFWYKAITIRYFVWFSLSSVRYLFWKNNSLQEYVLRLSSYSNEISSNIRQDFRHRSLLDIFLKPRKLRKTYHIKRSLMMSPFWNDVFDVVGTNEAEVTMTPFSIKYKGHYSKYMGGVQNYRLIQWLKLTITQAMKIK